MSYHKKTNRVPFHVLLQAYLKKRNMSVKEIAKALHITPQAVSNYKLGTRTPDIDTFLELKSILGFSYLELEGAIPIDYKEKVDTLQNIPIDYLFSKEDFIAFCGMIEWRRHQEYNETRMTNYGDQGLIYQYENDEDDTVKYRWMNGNITIETTTNDFFTTTDFYQDINKFYNHYEENYSATYFVVYKVVDWDINEEIFYEDTVVVDSWIGDSIIEEIVERKLKLKHGNGNYVNIQLLFKVSENGEKPEQERQDMSMLWSLINKLTEGTLFSYEIEKYEHQRKWTLLEKGYLPIPQSFDFLNNNVEDDFFKNVSSLYGADKSYIEYYKGDSNLIVETTYRFSLPFTDEQRTSLLSLCKQDDYSIKEIINIIDKTYQK